MNALKVVLLLVMISIALMGVAKDDNRSSNDQTVYALKMLLDKPIFVNAILSQVNPAEIMHSDRGDQIIAKIRVYNKVYEVSATHAEWMRFFKTRHLLPFYKKPICKQNTY